jgi:aspartyl-tRNA(Asn)/glutamyl-tRNA(Gln) amidotransferase subunit A
LIFLFGAMFNTMQTSGGHTEGSDCSELTAHELHQLMQQGRLTCTEIVRTIFARIDQVESRVKAYLCLFRDTAFEHAARIDEKIDRGDELGPLEGVPVALKDNLCTVEGRTTCASRILQDFEAPYDATVVRRLRDAGTVFVGKTNLDEFAMGSSTENSAFQITANPYDLSRVPGGSSGGSAAAVAADETAVALGSDTGGSIRQPAALCGIVGLKPTYGRVSRYGLVAFASSLDQIGPLAKDVEDIAVLMNVLAGKDPLDATSADMPVPDFVSSLNEGLEGTSIGVPREYFGEGIDDGVRHAVERAIDRIRECGADVAEVSLPHTEYAIPVYYIVANAEASANLARFDGVKYGLRDPDANDTMSMYEKTRSRGFGPEVKRRIMLGTYALSSGYYDAYYLKAQKVRTLFRRDFERAFSACDALVMPTSPTPAFRIGEKTDDPLQMYLSDVFTISANLAGLPALSMPCGYSAEGLPIGLQIVAKPFDELTVLRVAAAYERNRGFALRRPSLNGGKGK